MDNIQESLGAAISDSPNLLDGIETNVDIVFVIDASGTMEPMIEKVKNATLTFHENLYEELAKNHRRINNLRIKVTWFRDFYYDGQYAYGESRFFELSEEKEDFHDFVASIEAKGGGDEPESGLEALTLAMRSEFTQDGDKKRHIIVLFTDDAAHRFEDYDRICEEAAKKGCRPEAYPENMPKTMEEFYNLWEGNPTCQQALGGSSSGSDIKLDKNSRRLVIFAPDADPWSAFEVDLGYVIRKDMIKGGSGEDLDMDMVYALISNSMA